MNALRSCSSSSLLVAYQRPNLHAATKCLSLVQNQRASVTQIVSPQQFQSITNPDPNQYTPAKSWDGLEWVGGAEWRYKNHATDKFHHTRFGPDSPLPLRELEEHLYFSLLDLILYRSCSSLESAQTSLMRCPLPPSSSYYQLLALGNPFRLKDNERPVSFTSMQQALSWFQQLRLVPTHEQVQQLLQSSKQEGHEPQERKQAPEPTKSDSPPSSLPSPESRANFMNFKLRHAPDRFALLARFYQRTGHRLADGHIAQCTSVHQMYKALTSVPLQKKKLAHYLAEEKRLELPNISATPRKVGRLHHDVATGRWKVTRKELLDRGLPEFWPLHTASRLDKAS